MICSGACGRRTRCIGPRAVSSAASGRSSSIRTPIRFIAERRNISATGNSASDCRRARKLRPATSPQITGSDRMLVASDGELHRDFRKAFNAMFLPRAIRQYEESGRKLVLEILDEVLPRGRCEFVTEVATRLPMAIICDMMAIPRKDWQLMFDLVNQGMGAEDPEYQIEGSAVETRTKAWGQAIRLLHQVGAGAPRHFRDRSAGRDCQLQGTRRPAAYRGGDRLQRLHVHHRRPGHHPQFNCRRSAGIDPRSRRR